MAGNNLMRVVNKLTLQTVTKHNLLQSNKFYDRSVIPLKRCFASAWKNGNGDHSKNPDCVKLECDPELSRQDSKLPSESFRLKRDQLGAYNMCAPPQQKRKFTCADVPHEPEPSRRKRKPYYPASACRKPKPSISASECAKIKEDLCKRLLFPNCPSGRIPPTCNRNFIRPHCKRQPYSFPAFSECHTLPRDTRFNECECLLKPPICY